MTGSYHYINMLLAMLKKHLSHFTSLLLCSACFAQSTTAVTSYKAPPAVMNEFMDKRFGMFIHFGPVTLRGTEISWSRYHEVAVNDYDSLYREFDPVLFNADAWVRAAKDAGMKYITITAKHHDGFCLWPTSVSAYNIANSPFKPGYRG